jgi:hypothetical protein
MPLCIQELIAIPANPDFTAILNDTKFYPFVRIASLANNHQVGYMNRGFLRQDSTLNVFLWIGLCMFVHIVAPLYNRTVLFQKNPEHFSCFSAVLPGQHVNLVIFLYMQFGHRILSLFQRSGFRGQDSGSNCFTLNFEP